MIRDFYKAVRLEVIDDIHGEPHYVAEIKAAPKHGIEVCLGRPVSNTMGGRKIIMTDELAQFINSTLNHPITGLELPLSRGTINRLRRELQTNPIKIYQQWLDAPSRPAYAVFAITEKEPEYVYDCFGQRFVLYSAYMTDLGVPLLRGIDENTHHAQPKYILTEELAGLIAEYRYNHRDLADHLPFTKRFLGKLRRQLGYHYNADRIAWFASRIDDLIKMTPVEFHKKYSSYLCSAYICMVGGWVKTILTMMAHGTEEGARLLALLERYWSTASETAKDALNKHYGKVNSERIIRAYLILKLANKV